MKSAKPELLSELNKKAILELLRRSGPMSRADIKRSLSMSFPAVSANVKELIEAKLLNEVGVGDNEFGRKSIMLEFNSRYGYVMGIDIGRSYLRIMIADVAGNIIVSRTKELITPITGQEIVSQVSNQIDFALAESSINQLLFIVVGIPGIYDKSTNKYMLAPFVQDWENNCLESLLSEKLKAPIIIENSVVLGAIGEKWKGAGAGCKNIVYIDYGVGIGSAYIVNGELMKGANGAAGEIGYLLPNYMTTRSQFRDEGALEEEISGAEVDKQILDIEEFKGKTFKDLFEANSNNIKFIKIENHIKSVLCQTLINLSVILNPEIVIVNGGIGKHICKKHYDYFRTNIDANVPFPPKLVCSELGEKVNVFGAVGVALRNIHIDYNYLDIL